QFNTCPYSFTVHLLQHGPDLTIHEERHEKKGDWTFSFKDLQKYDGQGN
ncbi:Cna B-type domain-containing protein, partial [Bacillus nitratireducens]|nr:Cna B-type domain-containing protein [Bacillus nitratireducens]